MKTPGREAGRLDYLRKNEGRKRRNLRGLENNSAACRQRCRGFLCSQEERIVPWRDGPHYPDWLAQHQGIANPFLEGEIADDLRVVAENKNRCAGLDPGSLLDWHARFSRHKDCDLLCPRLEAAEIFARKSARLATEAWDQPSNAARAALTAASISAIPPSGTAPITVPVPESKTSMVSVLFGETHWPFMKSFSRWMRLSVSMASFSFVLHYGFVTVPISVQPDLLII